jgi:ketosteroid isomerase-like protein
VILAAMSELDVEQKRELVRRSIDGWNASDWEGGLGPLWDPEGEIVAPEGWPEPGPVRGWPALLGQWNRIKDSWAEEHVELRSVTPYGDRMLAEILWTMRGEASGAPLEVEMAMVYDFRGERIFRIEYFLDREAAQAAAEAGAEE